MSKQAKIIGIQGGKGSFNEEACVEYCETTRLKDYQIKYLYTSERVLQALDKGEIDLGQMAIQNAIGGMVHESVRALAGHKCQIADEFEFLVSHCLMVYPRTKVSSVKSIMSHPQALAQCHATLARKYPELEQLSGKGKLLDQSEAAKQLGAGKLDKNIAVLAPAICAKLYNLEIIDERLQDMKMNFTTFLWLQAH